MQSRRFALLFLSCLLAVGAFAGFANSASAAPANDNFADAESVKGIASEAGVNLTEATREASEPVISSSDTDHTVWFRWTAPSNGFLRATACGRGPSPDETQLSDFALGVYTGSSVSSLTPLAQASDDCSSIAGLVRTGAVPVIGGTTYFIQLGHATADAGAGGYLEIDFAQSLPVNDDWEEATALQAGLPQSVSGNNRLATVSNETALSTSRLGANSVWYSWTPDQSGTVAIDTCSTPPSFDDTIVEVFDDGGVEPVTIDQLNYVRYNDDGCEQSGNMSLLSTEVTAGTQYWIRIGNYSNSYGVDFTLRLRWPTSLTNLVEPSVGSVTKQPGNTLQSNDGNWWSPNEINYSYQWQRCDAAVANCVDISGQTSDSIVVSEADLGHTLRFAMTADDGDDTITVNSLPTLPIGFGASNDQIADAVDLGSDAVVNRFQDNQYSDIEDNEYNSVPYPIDSTVWFKWTASGTGSTTIGTCRGADSAPVYPLTATIGVHTGYDGNSVDSISLVASGSENCGGGDRGASVQFSATAGTTYWIQVGSVNESYGQFTLKINGAAAAPAGNAPVVTPADPFPAPKLSKLGTIKQKKGKVSLKKLKLTCGAIATGPCTGSLTLKTAKTKVKGKTVKSVSQTFKLNVKPGAKLATTFKLNKKMLAAIKKAKKLKTTVTVKLGAPGFSRKTAKTSATLKY